jgi:hypothetical protein
MKKFIVKVLFEEELYGEIEIFGNILLPIDEYKVEVDGVTIGFQYNKIQDVREEECFKESIIIRESDDGKRLLWYSEGMEHPYWISDEDGVELDSFSTKEEALEELE